MSYAIRTVAVVFFVFFAFLIFSTTITAQEFCYTIIAKDCLETKRSSLTIRLNKRISEDRLRKLAIELRDKEPRKYDRMFITYYLPDMTVGAGAWATTHFDPDLKVNILGQKIGKFQKKFQLSQKNTLDYDEMIGIWEDSLGSVTIIKKI